MNIDRLRFITSLFLLLIVLSTACGQIEQETQSMAKKETDVTKTTQTVNIEQNDNNHDETEFKGSDAKKTEELKNKKEQLENESQSFNHQLSEKSKATPTKAQEKQSEHSSEVNTSNQTASTTKREAQSQSSQSTDKEASVVTLSIVGDQTHGVILDSTKVEIRDEDRVLDVIKRATKTADIHLAYRGRGAFAYVEGIDQLYEFDHGPKSGWMFRVNGVFATKSAGSVKVKPGDQIEWLYTKDLGKDIGAIQ